ncbi:MAG: zinc dependent phospholipase C family protein, partial [Planctomycetales bacterium]
MKWFIPAILISVALLLFPSAALAWGIGVHLQTGAWILDNLAQLPGPLRTLLAAYPNDYLYGCISADITL